MIMLNKKFSLSLSLVDNPNNYYRSRTMVFVTHMRIISVSVVFTVHNTTEVKSLNLLKS